VALLEQLELSPETEAMWSTLCQLALEDGRLIIAERCCAALGDTSRAMFLRKVNQVKSQQKI
jgi:intraflagellar transport protein 172